MSKNKARLEDVLKPGVLPHLKKWGRDYLDAKAAKNKAADEAGEAREKVMVALDGAVATGEVGGVKFTSYVKQRKEVTVDLEALERDEPDLYKRYVEAKAQIVEAQRIVAMCQAAARKETVVGETFGVTITE